MNKDILCFTNNIVYNELNEQHVLGNMLEKINIVIDKETLIIVSLKEHITNIEGCIKLYEGLNIFVFLKSFKPIFNDYPNLNALLTQLKMIQRNHLNFISPSVFKFHNNFNFYENISSIKNNNSESPQNAINFFTIEVLCNNNIELIISAYGNLNDLDVKVDVDVDIEKNNIEFNTAQIKHELANSLNLISMSNILINNSLKNTELEKYTIIINNELKKTENILNTNKKSIKEFLTVQHFYKYLYDYLEYINTIYNIHEDGIINLENINSTQLSDSYLYINKTWFKIILDNIFKNIYGHIGDKYYLKLKLFSVYFNQENNTLCIDVINSKKNIVCDNTEKCMLYKEIIGKYGLDVQKNITTIKPEKSQGLNLINSLCEKQGIYWQLQELQDNIYSFKLSIPIHNKYNKKYHSLIKMDNLNPNNIKMSKSSKISKIYLNNTYKYGSKETAI